MGTISASTIQFIPGRLSIGPTDLSTAWPHGGTGLGAANQFRLVVKDGHFPIKAEEWSGQTWDSLWLPGDALFSAKIRGVDDDAMSTFWPGSSAGGVSGDQGVDWPGSNRGGLLLGTRAVKMLFSPNDQTNHRGVLLYNALPVLVLPEFRLTILGRENAWPAMFLGVRDGNDKVGQHRKLTDMAVNSS